METAHNTAEQALVLVNQIREMRQRSLERRKELQEKTEKMMAHPPYVLKSARNKQLTLELTPQVHKHKQ